MALHLTDRIHIARGPNEVWQFVADLDRERRWRRPYVTELVAEGDPLTPGARVSGTTKAFGQTDTYRNEVVEVQARRHLAWRGLEASGGLIGTVGAYDLVPEGGGTSFRLTMEYEPQGVWGRLQQPVLRVVLPRIVRRFLVQLKHEAETATT
ncbi:MAG: SRPBCC family protein [Vicinamibacterales bacterium]